MSELLKGGCYVDLVTAVLHFMGLCIQRTSASAIVIGQKEKSHDWMVFWRIGN